MPLTIAVAGTFTTEPLADALTFWTDYLGLPAAVAFAPYHQTLQQLLDPSSLVGGNRHGVNVVLVRTGDWTGADGDVAVDLAAAARSAAARPGAAALLIGVCPEPGETDERRDPGAEDLARRLDAALDGVPGVHLLARAALLPAGPAHRHHDPHTDSIGRVPYTPRYYAHLATVLARRVHALRTPRYKVLALDCDGTLWSGLCGEDGPDGVRLTAGREALHRLALAQHDAGMLICLCSRNNEADVRATFAAHPEFPLRPEQVTGWRVNWRSKSDNLRALAEELGLGLDSFVFVDDNPVECAEVRTRCPEVLTLCLPADDEPDFLAGVWAFDRPPVTGEDRRRTALYRDHAARERFRDEAAGFEEFLAGLRLRVDITPLRPEQAGRVAQLTARTTQFNAAPAARSETDIAALADRCLVVEVSDRFGDYGLVGAMVAAPHAGTLRVDTFLLSCRALGRLVERRMLAHLGAVAERAGLSRVEIACTPTARNVPARQFLERVCPDRTDRGYAVPADAAAAAIDTLPPEPAPAAPPPPADAPPPAAATGTHRPDGRLTSAQAQHIAAELTDPDRLLAALARPAPTDRSAPLRGGAQRWLARVWADVLRTERIGPDDSFLGLGGTSLDAVVVAQRIHAATGAAEPLTAVLDRPVLADFADFLTARYPDVAWDTAPTTVAPPARRRRCSTAAHAPLSPGEERLWLLDRLYPRTALHNVVQALRLRGTVDPTALRLALDAVVDRHDVLRSTIVDGSAGPVRVTAPAGPVDLARADLSAFADPAAALESRLPAETGRVFDLAADPPLRATLFSLAPDEHVLLLVVHHTACDDWSLRVLVDDLGTAYARAVAGRPATLPPPDLRCADFARQQRDRLEGGAHAGHERYWRERLAGLPDRQGPPPDRPPADPPSFAPTRRVLRPSRDTAGAVRAVCREVGATPFMVYAAVVQVLLQRRLGHDDVAVGYPVHGRAEPGWRPVVGFFVNTLVLRTDLSGDPTFADLLGRVRQAALAGQEHADVPFDRVVRAALPETTPRPYPLFEVLVNARQAVRPEWTVPGLAVAPLEVPEPAARFPLTVYLWDDDAGPRVEFVAQRDRLSPPTLRALVDQFDHLLRRFTAAPHRPVGEVDLAVPAHRAVLADPTAPLRAPVCPPVSDLVAAAVRAHPDRPAVRQGTREWGYRQLDADARALAGRLHAAGVRPGDVVAVRGHPGYRTVTAMYAVLAVGAVLFTVDGDLPPQRQAVALAAADARWLACLDTAALPPGWPSEAMIRPDRCFPAPPQPEVHCGPDSPAYVFLTSGTTGTPRAVLGRHNGLSHFVMWQRDTFGLGPGDRMAHLTGLSFDVVLRDVFTPLVAGATVCVPAGPLPADRVLPWLVAEEVTAVHAVPTLAAAWLADQPVHGPALRLVFSAGEPCTGDLVARWRAHFPAVEVVNLYGPTETTLAKVFHRLPPGDPPPEVLPAGGPLPDTQILVWAPDGRRCGVDEPGEVVIRTPLRSLGYRDADPRRFVPNPSTGDPTDLLFRTGDRGRIRPDGTLELLGRLDDQVKILGVRIEPAEVAATLRAHADVAACAVLADRAAGRTTLTAYVVPAPGARPDPTALTGFAATRLPAAMVPHRVVTVTALPTTANGKLDRAALRRFAAEAPAAPAHARRAPQTEDQRRLAAIWSAVLDVPDVALDDNFFHLGGNSLLAARVVARIVDSFGVEVELCELFAAPTLAALATAVTSPDARRAGPAIVARRRVAS